MGVKYFFNNKPGVSDLQTVSVSSVHGNSTTNPGLHLEQLRQGSDFELTLENVFPSTHLSQVVLLWLSAETDKKIY